MSEQKTNWKQNILVLATIVSLVSSSLVLSGVWTSQQGRLFDENFVAKLDTIAQLSEDLQQNVSDIQSKIEFEVNPLYLSSTQPYNYTVVPLSDNLANATMYYVLADGNGTLRGQNTNKTVVQGAALQLMRAGGSIHLKQNAFNYSLFGSIGRGTVVVESLNDSVRKFGNPSDVFGGSFIVRVDRFLSQFYTCEDLTGVIRWLSTDAAFMNNATALGGVHAEVGNYVIRSAQAVAVNFTTGISVSPNNGFSADKGAVLMPADNLNLSIIVCSKNFAPSLNPSDDNITIDGWTIRGNYENQAAYTSWANDSWHPFVGQGIRLNGANCKVINCVVEDVGEGGCIEIHGVNPFIGYNVLNNTHARADRPDRIKYPTGITLSYFTTTGGTICNNLINNTAGIGIFLEDNVCNVTLFGNTIENAYTGIQMEYGACYNKVLSGSIWRPVVYGVYLWGNPALGYPVTGNKINVDVFGAGDDGFLFSNADGNTFTGTVNGSLRYGGELSISNRNTVALSTIQNSAFHGLKVSGSNGTIVWGNHFLSNGNRTAFETNHIMLIESDGKNSFNTAIIGNTFGLPVTDEWVIKEYDADQAPNSLTGNIFEGGTYIFSNATMTSKAKGNIGLDDTP